MIISLAKVNLGGGGGGSMNAQDEYVIAMALNDLNDRLQEVENNVLGQ